MSRLLVVITTNEEKELPAAFLRRCIVHKVQHPDADRLVAIARLHFTRRPAREFSTDDVHLAHELAKRVEGLRTRRREAGRRPPGTAEFLDAVRACLALGVTVGDSLEWRAIERATLVKDDAEME